MIFFPQYNVFKDAYLIHVLGLREADDTVVKLYGFEDLITWYYGVLNRDIKDTSYLDMINIYNFIDMQACKNASSQNYSFWKISFLETVLGILNISEGVDITSLDSIKRLRTYFSKEYNSLRRSC